MPGAPGGVGQQVDPLDRGLGLGGGQAAGAEHGGAVLGQPGAHRPVAQCLAVAALVVPGIERGDQAAQPDDELARGEPTGQRKQGLADGRDLGLGEPGEMVGEDPHLGPVDVAGEECRVHLGKAVHELFGEVALPVGRAPRPGQGSAHLVGGMRDRAVEPVDGAVVEGGLRPADLGDHPEQPGRLVSGLTGLRDQQRQQVVVGHAGGVDPGQGGGELRARRDVRQGRHVVHHCHVSNIHSSTDSFGTVAAGRRAVSGPRGHTDDRARAPRGRERPRGDRAGRAGPADRRRRRHRHLGLPPARAGRDPRRAGRAPRSRPRAGRASRCGARPRAAAALRARCSASTSG